MATLDLPVPPESLRIWVGPFSDAELFVRSGEQTLNEIVALCGLPADSRVLEIGCGCGRLSRAFAGKLNSEGRYEGFDVARVLIEWCRQQLEPQLPNFRFSWVDVRAGGHNPEGAISGAVFRFPFSDDSFDLAVACSVFTHMLPDEIENYVAEVFRVLKTGGRCFMSVFLFDVEAETAVATGSTIFDFRHPVGPCLTFDRERPDEGIACRMDWFLELIEANGSESTRCKVATGDEFALIKYRRTTLWHESTCSTTNESGSGPRPSTWAMQRSRRQSEVHRPSDQYIR